MVKVWKKVPVTLMLLLICLVFIGTASADRGYTTTDRIPMAVDFTVTVELDSNGMPHVVTDYPFAETGATQMNLVYSKNGRYEAAVLNYNPATDATTIAGFDSSIYPNGNYYGDILRDIRDGVLTLTHRVFINTSHFGAGTDWVLTYSTLLKEYVEYTEKTYAQSFNAMAAGGTARTIYYENGTLASSRTDKRNETADLLIEYDRAGNLVHAWVQNYGIVTSTNNYDPSTGLFGKYTLSELGFDDGDLSIPALAAIGDTDEAESDTDETEEEPSEISVPATGRSPAVTLAGGLIAGILIGVTLYYLNRRRKAKAYSTEEKKEE